MFIHFRPFGGRQVRRPKIPGVIFAVVILTAASALLLDAQQPATAPTIVQPDQRPPTTSATTIVTEPLVLPGEVVARTASIRSLVLGKVRRVLIETGQAVKADDVLVELDSKTQGAELEAAENSLKSAQTLATLQKQRYERGLVDVSEQLQAQSNLEAAQLNLELCKLAMEKRTIAAPFDGVIDSCSAQTGVVVTAGESVAVLVVVQSPRVAFSVPQAAIGRVSRGTSVTVHFRTNAKDDKTCSAAVVTVSPTLEKATRTQTITAEPTGDVQGLMPGMYVTVEIGKSDSR